MPDSSATIWHFLLIETALWKPHAPGESNTHPGLTAGEDHRWYLPASACTGALILLGAFALAKHISSTVEIPVGIVTTLVGIPFFIAVLARRRRH